MNSMPCEKKDPVSSDLDSVTTSQGYGRTCDKLKEFSHGIPTNPKRWCPLEKCGGDDNDIVFLRSKVNGLYLKRAENDKSVKLSEFKGDPSQQFVLKDNTISSVLDGKVLEIHDPNSYFFPSHIQMALRDPCKSNQSFFYDMNSGRLTSGSSSFAGYCLEVKTLLSKKVVILLISKAKEDCNDVQQIWDIIPKSKKLVRDLSGFTSKMKMGGYMGSQCLEYKGEKVFFKHHKCELTLFLETGCSLMTNYLTGGFVPIAKWSVFHGEFGAFQPFINMNTEPFKKLTHDKNYVVKLDFMNQKQLHQLFVQMIADRLISNWDTHNEQFALDADGNVLGYDKEKAFYLFDMKNTELLYKMNLKEDYRRLDFHFNLWKNAIIMARSHNLFFIYSSFVHHIRKGTIKIDPNNEIIEDMFKRCESITLDFVRDCLEDYALRYYSHPHSSEFINVIYKRIKHIRKPVYHYFGWKGVSDDVPYDPWILDA